MSRSTRKLGIRTLAGVLAALAMVGAAAPARAATAYDGSWSVVIRSSSAECKTSQLPLRIENGSVGYDGYVPVSVSGSVGHNGAVTVRVNGGGRSANGSGQLSGNSGSGTWSGGSASSACAGTWSASRKA